MPGKPSSTWAMESPTGCTKQLISVAVSSVPAAELMRPAGTKPRCCTCRKRASHCARCAGASTEASARATRSRTASMEVSSPLAYFSSSTSWLIGCSGKAERVATAAAPADFLVRVIAVGVWSDSWGVPGRVGAIEGSVRNDPARGRAKRDGGTSPPASQGAVCCKFIQSDAPRNAVDGDLDQRYSCQGSGSWPDNSRRRP